MASGDTKKKRNCPSITVPSLSSSCRALFLVYVCFPRANQGSQLTTSKICKNECRCCCCSRLLLRYTPFRVLAAGVRPFGFSRLEQTTRFPVARSRHEFDDHECVSAVLITVSIKMVPALCNCANRFFRIVPSLPLVLFVSLLHCVSVGASCPQVCETKKKSKTSYS